MGVHFPDVRRVYHLGSPWTAACFEVAIRARQLESVSLLLEGPSTFQEQKQRDAQDAIF